jgi:Fe-S cluster biogenesis protein NfuA/glutaredoxin
VIGTLIKRLTVRTLDVVVERGKESERPIVRLAADGLDRARRLVGLDRFGLRTTPPAWNGTTPEQPMWQTDKDKLHKHRVDKGIIKPAAGTTMPVKPSLEPLVKLYIKRGCPYCRAAVDLLNERNLAFTQIDYSDDHDLRKAIRGQTGRKTSPHVFIRGKSIGGYDELRALDESGALETCSRTSPPPARARRPCRCCRPSTRRRTTARTRSAPPACAPASARAPGCCCSTSARPTSEAVPASSRTPTRSPWPSSASASTSSTRRACGSPTARLGQALARGDAVPAPAGLRPGRQPARRHRRVDGGRRRHRAALAGRAPPARATPARRVKLPVVASHPEKSPFEALLFPDAEIDATPLTGDALIARVKEVLEEVRPMVQSDGGDIELLDIIDDVVGVQLTGNCVSCPSSQATLRQGIERKLKQRIPQIKGISSPQLLPLT